MKNLKYKQQKKHKLVSKIPSYQVILVKLMTEWKLLEQQVNRTHGADKNSVIVHTDFRLV